MVLALRYLIAALPCQQPAIGAVTAQLLKRRLPKNMCTGRL
jgi:hypothetical protein